jgi:ceramide glucosyltransferase
MLETALLVLIIISWIYWLVAWWMVRRLFRAPEVGDPDFQPPVSILKPVKGLDAQAYKNFASFCRQDYPQFELLFGVADSGDPAVAVVERLQRDFPNCQIRLLCAPDIGPNQKASLLAHLSEQAQYEVLVMSDSDMRVTPDYLRWVVPLLAKEGTGLVNCLYRGEATLTLSAGLEALYMGVTFLPSAVVARRLLRMNFAMGGTVAVRRRDLARMGGFASIVDYLADDHQLGARIGQLGLQVRMADYVVASVLGATTFQEQWEREVRWARCTRVSRPLEYPGLLLTFSTPLSCTLLLASGFGQAAWLALCVSMALRWLVAWLVSGHTGDQEARHWLFWLPVRDLLTTLVWVFGLFGRRVTWRGETYLVDRVGRIHPLLPAGQPSLGKGHSLDR